jgi:alpha-D-xyloside xylohydrolase
VLPPSPLNLIDGGRRGVEWRHNGQRLRVEPWGRDAARVRVAATPHLPVDDFALLPPASTDAAATLDVDGATLVNGALRVRVSARGQLRFERASDGALLLDEPAVGWLGSRQFRPAGDDAFAVTQTFAAQDGERFYGLGQRRHGRLDQKGCVLDLLHHNTHVSVPLLLSSRGYAFLWNNPAVGRVELGHNRTQWTANVSRGIDYWIATADAGPTLYPDLYTRYAEATGFAPPMPDWATGFWQCKLRYGTQDELLNVAREHKRRGLPISVIVADYFHWTKMGEWKFDPTCWPDPAGMVRELDALGIKLTVSVWPTVNPDCDGFAEMESRGLLVQNARGTEVQRHFVDVGDDRRVYLPFIDSTNPEARAFMWDRVRENYVRHGIRTFWLDADEPEINPVHFDNLRFHAGAGERVAGLYPLEHCRAFFEGLKAEGEAAPLSLTRSTWAGGQRYGSLVWSGDIHSTFDELATQVRAGLNMQLSGIPWWTTDIGGFSGGDVNDPVFRELLVRWFQWAVFCPVTRLHGVRKPEAFKSGGPNEVWSFGDRAYAILRDQLALRERLRPYVAQVMHAAHTRGTPPMRPLFFDFPDDSAAGDIDDEYLFGPDVVVAPILKLGATSREVYLPAGAAWRDAWTGDAAPSGARITATAPLERIPVYVRDGAAVAGLLRPTRP